MNAPHTYPRRILLAVTGLSPQVVTETLYALALRQTPRFIPTEVHLITTAEGAERARLALLSDSPGWFHRLRADYGLPPIAFDARHIHVLNDGSGTALDDIRSPQDNLLAADFITGMMRDLTADPEAALHVSIAGGRKTMGFFLGYALSLHGRPQDRLSHVLVSEPFESSWEFFYPTPYGRVIETRDRKLADAATAAVTLAEIPFVSLRHGLPKALLEGKASFGETVEAARAALGPAMLTLDPRTRRICAAGRTLTLPPAQFALLAVLARRTQRGAAPLQAPLKDVKDRDWADAYLADLREACGLMHVPDGLEDALTQGVEEAWFSQHLSRLQRRLREALGAAAAPYLVDNGGTRPRRYRLTLPPDAVRFATLDAPDS
ncbi:MAG: CRISPR-associated ring nuclease Csm6 [Pseudomonadota bacterium]